MSNSLFSKISKACSSELKLEPGLNKQPAANISMLMASRSVFQQFNKIYKLCCSSHWQYPNL